MALLLRRHNRIRLNTRVVFTFKCNNKIANNVLKQARTEQGTIKTMNNFIIANDHQNTNTLLQFAFYNFHL